MQEKKNHGPRPATDRQWQIIEELARRELIDEESFANMRAAREQGEFTSRQATLAINPHAEEIGLKPIDTTKWSENKGKRPPATQETENQKTQAEVAPEEEKPQAAPEKETSDKLPERAEGEMDNRISVLARLGKKTSWFTFPMTADELEAGISDTFGIGGHVEEAYGQFAAGDLTYERIDILALDPRGMSADIGWSPAQDESLQDINLMTIALRNEDEYLDSKQKRDAVRCAISTLASPPSALAVASMACNASELPYNSYDEDSPALGDSPIDRYATTVFDASDFPALSPTGFAGMARAEAELRVREGAVILGEMGYIVASDAAESQIAASCAIPRDAIVHAVQGPYESIRESFSSYAKAVSAPDTELIEHMARIAADDPTQASRQLANAAALYEAHEPGTHGPESDMEHCRRQSQAAGAPAAAKNPTLGAR